MTLRAAEVQELCQAVIPAGNALATCNAKTDARCPRCGKPLCVRHLPAEGMRCRDCEDAFATRLRENIGRYVVVVSLALGVTGAVMITAALLWGSLIAVLPVAAIAATALVFLLSPIAFDRTFAKAIPRRALLKERKNR